MAIFSTVISTLLSPIIIKIISKLLKLKELIVADYPDCDMQIINNGALCSFYAEEGGFIVGFEDY